MDQLLVPVAITVVVVLVYLLSDHWRKKREWKKMKRQRFMED